LIGEHDSKLTTRAIKKKRSEKRGKEGGKHNTFGRRLDEVENTPSICEKNRFTVNRKSEEGIYDH